jgi:hypothetical protein
MSVMQLMAAALAQLLSVFMATTLLTNEYAHHNPAKPDAIRSPDWVVTAGSLFRKDGKLWTGIPDDKPPGAHGREATGSAVFRTVTVRRDYRDVEVTLDLDFERFVETQKTPAVAWDGVHVFLRYESAYRLYYVSVLRRDQQVVIKKKCPGGPSNDGTYYDLSPLVKYAPRSPEPALRIVAENQQDGAVLIRLYQGERLILDGIDRGVGCPAIREGGVGIRGDNAQFHFDFSVTERLVR